MDSVQSFILGIIQGITEFLPISSTAHLILVPWLFSWYDAGLPFNVAMHLGSLIAILIYFRHDWKRIVSEFIKCTLKGSYKESSDGRLGLFLVIGAVPGVISGFVFESFASGILRNPVSIAVALALFGLFLYFADRKTTNEKEIKDMNLKDCLFFGIAQAFAIIPGVSRSGVTVTGGLLRNFKREEAARFSFLLATPLIIGATVLESRHFTAETLTSFSFIVGIASSAVTSYFVIRFLLAFLRRQNFTIFVVYRLLLALLIIVIALINNNLFSIAGLLK